MGKFTLILLTAFCLFQNSFYTLANPNEQNKTFYKIVEMVGSLTNEIKETIEELANRLPHIIKKFEKTINLVIDDVVLKDVFKKVKEEIENIIKDNTSISSECSKMAYDEIDELEKKTNSKLLVCGNKIHKKTDDMQNESRNLIQKANTVAKDMAKKIKKCTQDKELDDVQISNCLENEFKIIKKMWSQIKEAISTTVGSTEKVSENMDDEIKGCLQDIKVDTIIYTEHVIDELKLCNTEAGKK